MTTVTKENQGGSGNEEKKRVRSYQAWQFENPDNAATKKVKGSTMTCCTNDCHAKPMWCSCKTFLNQSDYYAACKKMNEKKES